MQRSILALGLMLLVGCVDQELVDEVEAKCDTWIATANACIASAGGSDDLDSAQCDPINEAAPTSSNGELEDVIALFDCQIDAYGGDCSTADELQAAADAAQACLDAFQ